MNILCLVLLLSGFNLFVAQAQTPTSGLIFKAATAGTPGAAVLDPNGDGYVSASSAGFSTTDLGTASELPYRYLPQVISPREPMSDLRVGPNFKFTDFADYAFPNGGHSVGFYVDANNNFMFRFRLGGAAPNSKGYSIAIDTDGKFGFSGPDADPNAVVGNPGFEMEVLLASNFGVRLYNIDGTANPSDPGLVPGGGPDGSMVELPYNSYAQKAIAFTNNDGTLDVFYDFYIPLSVIQAEFGSRTYFGTSGTATPFSLSTPLRMVANTIIAPHSVTKYQNISDISGLDNVPNSDTGFINLIGGTTPTSGGSLPPGTTIPARTATPTVNCPVLRGATTVSGSSTESVGTVITVFVNGVAQSPTTTVQSGGTWSLTVAAMPSGALITATALATGKSLSATSTACQASIAGQSACSTPAPAAPICFTDKNIGGFAPTNSYVYLRFPNGTLVPARNGAGALAGSPQDPTSNVMFNPVQAIHPAPNGTTAPAGSSYYQFTSPGGNIGQCNSGQQNAFGGVYMVSVVVPGGTCESAGTQVCAGTTTTAPVPTVSTSPITTTTTSITGATVSGATVLLSVDGSPFSQVAAVGTSFTFSGASLPTLTLGRVLSFQASVSSGGSSSCMSAAVTRTVVNNRTVVPPIVNDPLYPGATTVTGTSVEAPGSVITVTIFTGLNATGTATTLSATATVLADGSWTLSVPALASNSSVRATVTPVDYSASAPSNVVNVAPRTSFVPTITNAYTEGNTSVTGTVPVNTPIGTVITVYIDGSPLTAADGVTPLTVTTTTTSSTTPISWTLSGLSSTPYPALYAGGILTATATAPSRTESIFSNQVPVGCVTFQNRTLSTSAICAGNTATITVANVEPGVIYTLQNATTGANLASSKLGIGTGTSSLSFTTNAVYTTAGSYPLRINAFSLGAIECSATAGTANLTVNPLPLTRTINALNPTITEYRAAYYGTNILVDASQFGVNYQLVQTNVTPNVNIGPAKPGTGTTVELPTGPISTTSNSTTFAVIGTNPTTGCTQVVGNRTVNYTGPLPVVLTAFDATLKNGAAVLTWNTASEKNNDHFRVERSLNGQEFVAVGQVAGQGTSNQPKAYTFTDPSIARLGSANVYYRLQQVDTDGQTSVSPVRSVALPGELAAAKVLLYPNPATSTVTLSLAQLPDGMCQVQIFGLAGKQVRTLALPAGQTHELDINGLPAGVYLVKVQSATGTQTQRLVKLR
ncbi:hypothetical protein GCM10023185_15920 [Hymenobacter saemangeumensis]|uniref:Secretion system C-terminal sorting domain-containing protein n=1 Tax=Hymenobacter saemangeumensis TaxID=1084522 RepID=A0ABP8I9V6_9BACT